LRSCIEAQDAAAVDRAQGVLDAHALFVVTISPEQRVKAAQGKARPELNEAGWRHFLVKVVNESGTTAPLRIVSGEAKQVFDGGAVRPRKGEEITPSDPPVPARWLDLQTWDSPPLRPSLSGLGVEYRILALYSRDAGPAKRGSIRCRAGDAGSSAIEGDANVLFECRPAREITLRVLDENGAPCTAGFEIRDRAGRVYPSPIKRLAPDFGFHPQIYRADGEKLHLPNGEYNVVFQRGPESIAEKRDVKIGRHDEGVALPGSPLGRSLRSSDGGAAIIISTPRVARTTRRRPKEYTLPTWRGTARART
jgi:hypothetical protein